MQMILNSLQMNENYPYRLSNMNYQQINFKYHQIKSKCPQIKSKYPQIKSKYPQIQINQKYHFIMISDDEKTKIYPLLGPARSATSGILRSKIPLCGTIQNVESFIGVSHFFNTLISQKSKLPFSEKSSFLGTTCD